MILAPAIWFCILVTASYALAAPSKFRSSIALYSLWAISTLNAAGCARCIDEVDKEWVGKVPLTTHNSRSQP
jgi:hypothetical protein